MPVTTRSERKKQANRMDRSSDVAALKGNSSPRPVRKTFQDDQSSIRQRGQKTKGKIPVDLNPKDCHKERESTICDVDTGDDMEDETYRSDDADVTNDGDDNLSRRKLHKDNTRDIKTSEKGRNYVKLVNQPPKAQSLGTKSDNLCSKSEQKGSSFFVLIVLFVCTGLVVLYIGLVTYIKEGSKQAHPNETQFIMDIQSLQSDFPSQDKHLWETVVATVKYHDDPESEPTCPIILLFGSRAEASRTSRCLVKRLGQTLSQTLGRESSHAAQIDGQHFKHDSADDAKLKMDRQLREAFEEKTGPKAATILNLDAFPPCSVLLFHSYCDTDNAIFKNVALIFTVTLDGLPPGQEVASKSKHWETLITDHLTKVWVDKCSKLPREKVEALLSRLANNIAIVRQEKQPKC